jgi:hypothetical protein
MFHLAINLKSTSKNAFPTVKYSCIIGILFIEYVSKVV